MRHLKVTMIVVASLVFSLLLGMAGCGDHHGDRNRGDRDRSHDSYERHDGDRR